VNRQTDGCGTDSEVRGPHLIEFDIRGRVYPSTLLKALREVDNHRERIRSGAVKLLFRTDNPLCSLTIPDAASAMGHEVSVSRDGDHFLIIIGGDYR
jgi:hypothetical protein